MTQYSSLSPIPGFKNWLTSSIKNEMKGKALIISLLHKSNRIFICLGEPW